MWVCTVYRSKSYSDRSKEVIRVHAIGRPENIQIEMMLGVLELGKPDGTLALVQGEDEETARDIARYFAGKLGLELEL